MAFMMQEQSRRNEERMRNSRNIAWCPLQLTISKDLQNSLLRRQVFLSRLQDQVKPDLLLPSHFEKRLWLHWMLFALASPLKGL
ncbi:unnamed protein product, partial [Brenthis ino]